MRTMQGFGACALLHATLMHRRLGNRTNFLRSGTVARGAAESGQVESYMYGKVQRNLLVKPYCADFRGVFFAGTPFLWALLTLLIE